MSDGRQNYLVNSHPERVNVALFRIAETGEAILFWENQFGSHVADGTLLGRCRSA